MPVCVGADLRWWCHLWWSHLPPAGGPSAPRVDPAWPVNHLEGAAGAGPRQAPPTRLPALPASKNTLSSSSSSSLRVVDGWIRIRAASLTPYSKHCDAPTLPSFLPEYIKSFYWGKVFLICSLLKFFMILSWLVLQGFVVRFECFKVKHKISSGLSLLTDQTPSCPSCLSGLSSGVGAEDVWVVLWLQELLWGQSKAAGLPEDPHSCEETHTHLLYLLQILSKLI